MTSHAVTEKRCSKCAVVKSAADFYSDKYKLDGLCSSCKACSGAQARKSYYDRREKALAQKAELRKDPEWRRAQRVMDKVYRHRNPQKMNARRKAVRAVAAGMLKRMPCEKCGDLRSQGHHEDYTKPLEVRWLCYTCHGKEHRRSPEGLAALEVGR